MNAIMWNLILVIYKWDTVTQKVLIFQNFVVVYICFYGVCYFIVGAGIGWVVVCIYVCYWFISCAECEWGYVCQFVIVEAWG